MKPWTKTDSQTGRFIRQQPLLTLLCKCGRTFHSTAGRVKDGRGKFCSRECLYKYRNAKVGEAHYLWSGSEPKYSALHKWVAKTFGQPMECEWCGFESENPYQIQWANLTGRYARERSDWARLCAKCHYHYDREGIHA